MVDDKFKFKPILLIPPDCVSDDDVKRLNDNGMCTVVAKDPALIKFLDPIPSISSRTGIENAAIKLSRKLLNRQFHSTTGLLGYSDIYKLYLDLVIAGTPLDAQPSAEEVEKKIFNEAKAEEIRKLAREEAKEERAKLKAEKNKS